MQYINAEEIFEITATLGIHVKDGQRLISSITGGTVKGRINGTVLGVGAEFGRFISPITYQIDVRAAIQTDDGVPIYITYGGFMNAQPETLMALFSGKGGTLDPSSYYWRTNPVFETSGDKYDWLNHIVAVGFGKFNEKGEVVYNIFEIK